MSGSSVKVLLLMLSKDCRWHEYKLYDTAYISFAKGNGSRRFSFPSLSVSASDQQICLSARLSVYGLPYYSSKIYNFRSKHGLKLQQQSK